jgi:aldehyde:ferredoxin oxidoreductase
MIEEIEEVAYLNDLCDRLGMDTITAGNICSLLMQAKEQGRIGYDIGYGSADQTAELLGKICKREGIGNILADGIKSTAEYFDLQDLAIHVKGMEPAGYDPRYLKGMGLTFATAPRGACHLRTTFYKPELSGVIPPDQIKDKAKLVIDYEDRLNIFDSLILCRMYRDLYDWEELAKSIKLMTGLPTTKESLRRIAVNIADMTRRFNIQEGLTANDDRLPERFYKEVLPEGASISKGDMDYLLQDYYKLRGWNAQGTVE